MRILNFTYARKSLTTVLAECEESNEPVCIVTAKKGGKPPQQMVIITKEMYDGSNLEEVINQRESKANKESK